MDCWLNCVKLKRKITDTDQEEQASSDIPSCSEPRFVGLSVNEVPSTQQPSPSCSSVSKKSNLGIKVRMYNHDYLELGFTMLDQRKIQGLSV